MMRKYISIFTLLLLFNACSDEQGNEVVKEKEALSVNANIAVSVVTGGQTRADEAFTKNFDLYMRQTAPTTPADLRRDYTLHDTTYDNGNYAVIKKDDSKPWYWDDRGGINAKLNLIGIYPKGATVGVASSVLTFSWAVVADQSPSTVDHDNLDLRISKLKEDYTLNIQKTGTSEQKNLEFSHVLSQLTFILEKGTGFEVNEAFEPTIETIKLQTEADITIAANGVVSIASKGTATEMVPKLIGSPATNASERTFVAIAIPGQKFVKGAEFATISLTINGEKNTYKIPLPSTLADDIEFKQGTNHQFTIKVNKTQSQFLTATIAEWSKGDGAAQTVNIAIDDNSINGENSAFVDNARLYVMIKEDDSKGNATEVTGGENLRRTTTYTSAAEPTDSKWEKFSPTLYWDDIPKTGNTYAYGLLVNKAIASDVETITYDDAENIYMGKSQALEKAYEYLLFKNMPHPFSRLDITIQTEKDKSYTVDLTKLNNIRFHNVIHKFKEIATGTQVITYNTNDPETYLSDVKLLINDGNMNDPVDPTYNYYKVASVYIKPGVTVPAGKELLWLSYKNGQVENEYPLVWDENKAITFQANNTYEIVITLKKTEIANLGVTIKDWSTGQKITGSGTIKD
ncbi:fimbrillin family protein [Bacteroides sp. 51]|uniref:fimbrillin family protein n=1 Tax=Bacteroides sp. 51 TaxID=2302938 RepID=UPI0013D8329F|nr:fimbrillin family protein [Bacteroides sp. 51]NDV80599.1 hypothetical protein [Bacteroides sp. 51]